LTQPINLIDTGQMFSAESMAEIPALDQLPAQPSLQEATA